MQDTTIDTWWNHLKVFYNIGANTKNVQLKNHNLIWDTFIVYLSMLLNIRLTLLGFFEVKMDALKCADFLLQNHYSCFFYYYFRNIRSSCFIFIGKQNQIILHLVSKYFFLR